MILCEIKKMDGKCRLQIPTKFIKSAGGQPDSKVYVRYNEKTREIKITLKEDTHAGKQ